MIHSYKKFLSKKEIQGLKEYFEVYFFTKPLTKARDDKQVKGAKYIYEDPIAEYFMCSKKSIVEKVFKTKLIPAYTYTRLYYNNHILPKHKDRPACEVSLTLNIWQDLDWPICFEKNKKIIKLVTKPGDAVFYEGPKYEHWREPYTGETCCQIFMHYVRENGPHKDWGYDGLGHLTYPKEVYKKWLK